MSYCGYLKITENSTSVENTLDENSDSECFKNEDIGDNESVVPDSDPDSSNIEVFQVGANEIFSDHTDLGDEWDNYGPNTVNDATVTANANIPSLTTNFTDITVEPFTQDIGPCLPENFDVSVAIALDYFNLLFKSEIFSDIKDHINNYAIFKQEKIQRNKILTMLIVDGRKPQLKN